MELIWTKTYSTHVGTKEMLVLKIKYGYTKLPNKSVNENVELKEHPNAPIVVLCSIILHLFKVNFWNILYLE